VQGARDAYAKALQVYSKDFAPSVWAEIQRSLAELHLHERNVHQPGTTPAAPSDVAHIESHYYAAVTVFSPHYLKYSWAESLFGLARAYWREAEEFYADNNLGDAEMRCDSAIEALSASNDVFSADEMSVEWISTQVLHGRILALRYSVRPDVNEADKLLAKLIVERCRSALNQLKNLLRIEQGIDLPLLTSSAGAPTPKLPSRFTELEKKVDALDTKVQTL
jgi:hypothetical protein